MIARIRHATQLMTRSSANRFFVSDHSFKIGRY
jgi:hypothetical protein